MLVKLKAQCKDAVNKTDWHWKENNGLQKQKWNMAPDKNHYKFIYVIYKNKADSSMLKMLNNYAETIEKSGE